MSARLADLTQYREWTLAGNQVARKCWDIINDFGKIPEPLTATVPTDGRMGTVDSNPYAERSAFDQGYRGSVPSGMTLERAVAVLNERKYQGLMWEKRNGVPYTHGQPFPFIVQCAYRRSNTPKRGQRQSYSEFEAIAIAKALLCDTK